MSQYRVDEAGIATLGGPSWEEFAGEAGAAIADPAVRGVIIVAGAGLATPDRKSTRLNSSHRCFPYAGFCLKNLSHDPVPTPRTDRFPGPIPASTGRPGP